MSSDKTTECCTETAVSAQLILQNVEVLGELSSQLKKETRNGELHLNSLNNLLFQAGKDVTSLHQCVDSLLAVARKLVYSSLQVVPTNDPNFRNLKTEADKLLNALDEIQYDEGDHPDAKWRHADKYLKSHPSAKSLIVDEKYPEHCSKESLLDMNNIVALPTVLEDVFTDFYKPSRALSSTSLKNLRKVKKCLQRVHDVDDEEPAEVKDCVLSSPCK